VISNIRIGGFGKLLIGFAGSQLVVKLITMVSGFLVVKLLLPEEYGYFTGIGIFLGYLPLAHLGILSGMRRELPYSFGKGDNDKVQDYADAGLSISILIGIIAGLVLVILAIKNLLLSDFKSGIVYGTYSLAAFLFILNRHYFPSLYRTTSDFKKLANLNLVVGFSSLALVGFVFYFEFYGLCLRTVFIFVIEFIVLFVYTPIKAKPHLSFNVLKKLFKTGLPIFAVGQINPVWGAINNTLIFTFGGSLAFGYFALANIVNSTIGILHSTFSQVIYPTMAIKFGKGMTIKNLILIALKPTIFLVAILGVGAVIGVFLLPMVVNYILPKYSIGIATAQWTLFIGVASSIGLVNNVYTVVKQQKWYFVSLFTGATVGIIYVLMHNYINEFSLVVFPQAMILGIMVQNILSFLFLKKLNDNLGSE